MPNETIELEADTPLAHQFGAEEMDFAATNAFAMPGTGFAVEESFEEETVVDAAPVQPNLDVIMNIPVTMQVVLGSTVMPVAHLMKLGRGAVVKLDTNISDPVDLMVNGRVVARGEVVVLENEDQRFGITLTEIVSPAAQQPRSKSAGI